MDPGAGGRGRARRRLERRLRRRREAALRPGPSLRAGRLLGGRGVPPSGRPAGAGFPQGTWSPGCEGTPEELARAELAEETGLRAGTLRRLGHLDLAPGLSTQEFDVWLATDLTPGPTAREASEADMTCAFIPEPELRARIRDGRFPDGPSVAAYGLLLLDRE